jgi:hypothetical protein
LTKNQYEEFFHISVYILALNVMYSTKEKPHISAELLVFGLLKLTKRGIWIITFLIQ